MLAGFGGFYEMVVDGICEVEGDSIAADYRATVDKYTCSKTCPCPQGASSANTNFWTTTVPTERLAASNRTADVSGLTTNQEVAYRYHGDSADVTPLVFADSTTTTTYDNFDSCFMDVLEASLATSDNAALETLKVFHDGGGFTALKWLEEEYNCASMCTAPLFYTTLSIDRTHDALPQEECLAPVLEDAKTNFGPVAYIAIATGAILIIMMFAAYPLCTPILKDEDGNDKETAE